nr:DUF4037 domain-containing protein [Frankia sp. AgB32]
MGSWCRPVHDGTPWGDSGVVFGSAPGWPRPRFWPASRAAWSGTTRLICSPVRRVLAWYPDDVWRCVLAAGWLRVSQEEPFVGRTGGCGDDRSGRG